jgi:uncharacterized membrane protein
MAYGGFFPCFGLFFFLLITGLIILNIFMWRRRKGGWYTSSYEALEILKKRLASGEIDSEEYNRIYETLKNNK